MIDGDGVAPSPACGIASNAAAASTSASGRSVAACAARAARRRSRRRRRRRCRARSASAPPPFWPQPLILFTKLIWTSQQPHLLSRRCAGTIRRPRARQGAIPARPATRHRESARRRRAAARSSSSASRVSSSSLRRPDSRSTSSTQLMSSDWLKPTRRAWSRGASARLDAEEAGQVDDAVQVAAQVGDAEEPAVAVRHRHHRREGEDLARLAQRKEEAARAALDRQPRLRRAARCARPAAVRRGGSGDREGLACSPFTSALSRRRGSWPSARSGRPA